MIVSVVTPVLNGSEYLARCIESVNREREVCRANGSGVEIEHVIADGGSTDGSVELAQSYGIEVIRENGTDLYERLNRAYLGSRGELIGFLGADDVLLEGGISALSAVYVESGRRWVVGSLQWIDPDGRSLGVLDSPPEWITSKMYASLGWNLGGAMATYYSRGLFAELGGFDPGFAVCADYALFTRALARAPYARLKKPVAASRRSGHNMSVVRKQSAAEEQLRIVETYGPRGQLRRAACRILLKCWVNLHNPSWLAHKLIDRAQVRLRLKKIGLFD